jgi:hypothetical protein
MQAIDIFITAIFPEEAEKINHPGTRRTGKLKG